MARVTVEDCIEKVPNRFGLVLLAGNRARAIANGAVLTIDRDNDKNPVVALRELADETVIPDELRETVIVALQRVDERTDLYALGVTFFEMLTGIMGNENPMLEKVKGRTSIYQLILRQNLPSPLVRIVLKCLEGPREKRYSSARALFTDLEDYERLPQAALEM